MTKFEAIKFTNDGWIWKVTHCEKAMEVLVEFKKASEKILEIINHGGEPNVELISKAIAWSAFKKMAIS